MKRNCSITERCQEDMGINISKFGNAIEKLMFNDTCTIQRHVQGATDTFDGSTNAGTLQNIYTNEPCKLSFVALDNAKDQTIAQQPVKRLSTLFIGLRFDIREGDYIIAGRKDLTTKITQSVKGYLGKSNRFDTHQEISIDEESEA